MTLFRPIICRSPFLPPRGNDLWLAGDLLVLYQRAFPVSARQWRTAAPCATCAAWSARPSCSRAERVAAADTLDALRYLPPDLAQLVHVQQDRLDFWMGKYPVTNAQYERFLQPENFANPKLWLDYPKLNPDGSPAGETWGNRGWEWVP